VTHQLNRYAPATTTSDGLRQWVQEQYGGEEVIVLANREPFGHRTASDGRVICRHTTSGVVRALEPLVRATSGVWIAHGADPADRLLVDETDGLNVPPHAPCYRLRRVWLDDDEVRGYYDGFANEGLWPLCHRVHVRPVFRPDDFNSYWAINSRFVDALCDEAQTESPIVLVQDYHFALAPRMIRERLPRSAISAFWHIPWPTWHTFEICPWGRHLLQGILAADVLGFQTPADCRSFLDTVERFLEVHIDREQNVVTHAGARTLVRAYAASIEWPDPTAAPWPDVETCRVHVRRQLGVPPGCRLAVSVARLDYTKGIEEGFAAVERLLECYPEYRGSFTFVQIAEPSRSRIRAYRDLHARVRARADGLNNRFGQDDWRPVILLDAHHEPPDVHRFLRAADVCYVGSLHDGMNLVAKEFVAARDDERGALVLSAFAGAARELTDALLVNPYDIDGTAQGLACALSMPVEEQQGRLGRMRVTVAEQNAYTWAGRILADAARARVPLDFHSQYSRANGAATTA
jgi:trehalose 6-phosphate synthase